jgi:formylglycine-generating enzyme required for sulfatase activity
MNNNQWLVLKSMVLPASPYLFLDTEAAGKPKRFYRITTDARAPQLVHINPGQFVMGSPVTENDRFPDEGPQMNVTISKEFWMGKYEVTQAEYQSVMGHNPSSFPEDLSRPVESVSWEDANNYCAKLTAQERAAGRLSANQAYRLPTEAEWEYVARAGTKTRFSYGDDPGFALLSLYGWFGAISDEITHPVGLKLPNPWGLSDMHANVWEWCADWYFSTYVGGSVVDPLVPAPILGLGQGHVIRGGSWKGLNRFCRSASRSASLIPGSNVGFRVVLAATRP